MWLWAVLWLDIAHSFGLFLFNIWIKITWIPQGCQELNVIRPSCTLPRAVRSSHGKWKPKFRPEICCQILHLCISYSNKTGFSQWPKVKLKCQHFSTMAWTTSEFSRGHFMRNCCGFLSHTYCQVKALGITYFVYPHIYKWQQMLGGILVFTYHGMIALPWEGYN